MCPTPAGLVKPKRGARKKEKREKERARKRRGLVVFGKWRKEDLGVLDRDADQESWTRIEKMPCGLYRD
ncbi:hypothetical protein TNCV_2830181 [Trichonephila clavipes]|nr:hypothetical protein TNCV_2830181 [Trichonephila clavipes]